MAGQIAEAFVRVRADTRGLKGEVEKGTRNAFSGVAKTVGGVFAVTGAFEAAKHVADAAASQQEELAVVRKAVADTNSAWVVHGQTVKETLRQQAVDFGFTVTDLAQGFTRIQVGTKDTARSFQLLGLAEDVARARHLGLAQAAVILTRAAQGNDVSLRRLGIVIPKVTENVDALKKRHDEYVASGASFTKQQKLEYQNALAVAAALDKQATKTQIVAEVRARFGGQAAAFAGTASGAFARFHEAVNEFEVAIGNGLLPTLTRGALASTHFFQGLANNQGVAHAAAEVAHDLGAGLHFVAVGFGAIEPVAAPVLRLLKEIAGFAGAGGILTAVTAYKSLGIVVGLNTAIQTRYAAVKAAGSVAEARSAVTEARLAGTQEGLAASTAASTATIAANTEALVAQAAAQTRSAEAADAALAVVDAGLASTTVAADAAAASLAAVHDELVVAAPAAAPAAAGYEMLASTLAAYDAELVTTAAVAPEAAAGIDAVAAAEVEAGAAGVAAGGGLAAFGRGLATLLRPQTLIAAGLAGFAFVVYKMVTAESAWEAANRTLRTSLENLGAATRNLRNDEAKLADVRLEIPTLQASKAAAGLALERDRLALANTKAAKGSLEYRTLVNQVAQDEAQLKQVTHDLSVAQNDAVGTAKKVADEHRDQSRAAAKLVTDTLALAAVQKRLVGQGFPSKSNGYAIITSASITAAQALAKYTGALRDDARQEQKNEPLLARNARILADYADSIGRFPTRKETTFVLNLKKGQGFANVAAAFGSLDPGIAASLAASSSATDAVDTTVKSTAAKVHDSADAAATTITTTVKDYAARVGQAVKDAQYQVAQAQQGLADTIRQGAQNVADSITSAKQNLNSIGGSLADAIGRFLDAKGSGGLPASAALTKEFKHLKDLIASGADPAEIKKAADEVKAQLDARAAAAASTTDASKAKDHVKTALANLTDLLNKGAITREQFEKRVTKLLQSEGITRANILKKLGVAAADEFSGLLTGLKQQADALVRGPHAAGTGLIPAIVKPLDALKQAERDTAAAQHSLQVAQRDLASQQLAEQKKAVAEAKKQAEQLAKIHAAQQGTAFTATLVAGKDGTYTFKVAPKAAPAKKAGGGSVHGPAGRDVIPTMLTAGEVVFNEPQQHGLRGMLGLGPGSPDQLFAHVAGASRFAGGGVAGHPQGYATGGAAAPGPPADPASPAARRAEIKRFVEQTFTATAPQGARIASELLSLHLSKPELAFISRYSASAGDAAMRAKARADRNDALHTVIPALAHAADVAVAGGVIGDIRHGRHGWSAGLDALSVIPLLKPVKALRAAVDAGRLTEAGAEVGEGVRAAEKASAVGAKGVSAGARAIAPYSARVVHITTPESAKAIRAVGFDVSHGGGIGTQYGPGVYLADEARDMGAFWRAQLATKDETGTIATDALEGHVSLTRPFRYAYNRYARSGKVIGRISAREAIQADRPDLLPRYDKVAAALPEGQALGQVLRESHYDGLVIEHHGGDEIVAFHPQSVRFDGATATKPAAASGLAKSAPQIGRGAAATARELRGQLGANTAHVFGEFQPEKALYPRDSAKFDRLSFRQQVAAVEDMTKQATPAMARLADGLGLKFEGAKPVLSPWRGKSNLSFVASVKVPGGGYSKDFEKRLGKFAAGLGRGFRQGSLSFGRPVAATKRGDDIFSGVYWNARGKDPAAVQAAFDRIGEGEVGFLPSSRRGRFYVVNFGLSERKFAAGLKDLGVEGPRIGWEGSYAHDKRLAGMALPGVPTFQGALSGAKGLGSSIADIASATSRVLAGGVPRLPWVEPPARLALRKGTGAVGAGPTGLAPGKLGDVVEAAVAKLGFPGTHPGSRLGDFDVAWDHSKNVFEVKARTTYGTEYKYGFKTAAREKKLAAAAREGLNPHTMIVVVDPDDGVARAYWREGLSSSRLGRDWNYAGSTKVDVGAARKKAEGGVVSRLADGGVADRVFAPHRFAAGGVVPGPLGAGDIVPALLSPGELVVPRHQVAVESGSEIAYRQREAQLVEARRQTRLLERIADGQRSTDPRLARLVERVRDGESHRSRSRAAETAAALVGGTL